MVNLTRDAVDFVLKIGHRFDNPEQCKIDCVTIDAVQGETFDYVVLALPPTAAEWSGWLCDATRLLTLISRNRWQMTMPWVREANPCVHDPSKSSRSTTPVSAPVQAILDLQRKHDKCWSVSRLMTWLLYIRCYKLQLQQRTACGSTVLCVMSGAVSYTHLTLPTKA